LARPKSTDGIDRRDLILETATRLFIEQGVDNTSLKDIARAADISTGTLFYYYESKSHLIFDVTDRHFTRMTEELLEWVAQTREGDDPHLILERVFQTICGDTLRGKLHHYLIEEAASSDPSIRLRFAEKYREWRRMICEGLEHILDGRMTQPAILAQIILAVLDGLVIQSILGIDDVPVSAVSNYLVDHSIS